MRITLTVTDGPHKGQSYSFSGHDTFLVGRSKRAHFRLPQKDRYFSRIHFLVEVNPPHCRIMDMGSRNGTFVNNKKVEEVADLKDNDQIRAGHTVLRVHFESTQSELARPNEPASAPSRPTAKPAPTPPARPRPASVLPSIAPTPVCLACDTPVALASTLCQECQALVNSQPQPIDGYQVIRVLGQGAMGMVHLALRSGDNLLVALKTVVPAVAGTPAQVDRFLREAQILRQLTHPNIVAFRDMGEANGNIFFAMDYVRGVDASQLLRDHGPLAIPRAVNLVSQLLLALDYAHQRGYVHRDIKPANLMVTLVQGREEVRLADFGLARVYQASHLSGLTVTGDIGGTLAFIAPEQITHYRESRPPVDQYAAAATLYNLLTGQYIYDLPREIPRQLALILNEDPVPITDRRAGLPAALAAAIHKGLARDPGDRHPDVKAFHDALQPFSR
jgi:serine/threonine-protein kinase